MSLLESGIIADQLTEFNQRGLTPLTPQEEKIFLSELVTDLKAEAITAVERRIFAGKKRKKS